MDNQASQTIKKFLTKNQCELMWVEPHNHCINVAERAIQTFKDHFVSMLATTDSKFPLQLWDRLPPQVKNILNMLCPSLINPNVLAYKAVHGPYNWNWFPLASPGCKAMIYESLDRGVIEAPMLGTLGCHLTTINATIILSRKHELVRSLAQPNCSHNIAKFPF